MTTVSATVKLIPRPPARVVHRNTKDLLFGLQNRSIALYKDFWEKIFPDQYGIEIRTRDFTSKSHFNSYVLIISFFW